MEYVKLLLHMGTDINIRDRFGGTPLIRASIEGKRGIVKLLLDLGADINLMGDDNKTALMGATTYGNTDIVKLLLDMGANPNIRDNMGYNALEWATISGDTESVELLKYHMNIYRIQSLQRGKMTRRKINHKLNTSMAQKRSRLSQIGDRYDLGDDVIRMLNSRMTRPNRTDMIDEIPSNMIGSGKRSKRSKRSKRKSKKSKSLNIIR